MLSLYPSTGRVTCTTELTLYHLVSRVPTSATPSLLLSGPYVSGPLLHSGCWKTAPPASCLSILLLNLAPEPAFNFTGEKAGIGWPLHALFAYPQINIPCIRTPSLPTQGFSSAFWIPFLSFAQPIILCASPSTTYFLCLLLHNIHT